MTTSTYPALLTPEQAADILCVSPHTLAVWRSSGRYELPFIKTGRLVRYRIDDIEAFIASRSRGQLKSVEHHE